MGGKGKYLILVVLIILLVLAAVVIATRSSAPAVAAAAIGGLARKRTRSVRHGGGDGRAPGHTGSHPHELHPLGLALERYARSLGPEHSVGVHPLDRDRYEPLGPRATGGAGASAGPIKQTQFAAAARRRAAKQVPPKKPWTAYDTWEDLMKDEGATAQYFEQRAAVINNPNIDWGPVLREILPKLGENREYIGLVNLDPDEYTLRLAASEASPVEAGTLKSDTAFAAVPGELVAKYAKRPALFIFHTHPADPRGSPLPSSHDLSTCIYLAATARFAASVVISRYGVFAYGLDWGGYKAVNEAQDWTLAMLNLSHDIVAAHEAVRSWSAHTLQDYLAFYARHRLFIFVYPTPEMVGDSRHYSYLWNLESPIDHEVIREHSEDIKTHIDKKATKGRKTTKAEFAKEIKLDLGFD